ncbi:MAG: alanine racemase [Candidatus Omnitrophica bacterium]|nr:alanine racemase [Candidatus Omnitrophota bacterium]MDD5311040.1 alanine racemase [Candidatus Omnitrophota bacterium]MDD5546536.1 alanine racemase [Candidatus Omnitrophota bacterium]
MSPAHTRRIESSPVLPWKGRTSPAKSRTSRPTWTEIDLDAIAHNYHALKARLSKDTNILAVVKANAYGYGMVEVARRLQKEKVPYLGVACVDEGIALRRAGIRTPVLVLSSVLPKEAEYALYYDLTLTVCDKILASAVDKAARKLKKQALVHVKVDTGMGRLGVWHDEAGRLIKDLLSFRNIVIEGIFTHFASADEEDVRYTSGQIENFKRLATEMEISGIEIQYVHAANSAGAMLYKDSHFNMVRPGLMLYGLYPNQNLMRTVKLKPALSLKTRIIYLKKTPPGRYISYGRTHMTDRETVIATLPVGYADGLNRHLSNKGEVLVRGWRAPVVGRICMDHTMVDVGGIKGAKVGDEAVIIGSQKGESITVEDIAELLDTIPYEVVCWISARVPRIYV